jgi:hypothetical protein
LQLSSYKVKVRAEFNCQLIKHGKFIFRNKLWRLSLFETT